MYTLTKTFLFVVVVVLVSLTSDAPQATMFFVGQSTGDFNRDGITNFLDLAMLLQQGPLDMHGVRCITQSWLVEVEQ